MTDIAMKNNGTALLNQRDIETNLETARRFLNRDYVLKLSTASGIAQKPSGINTQHIRMFRIGRIVYDGQDTAAKLLSVYNTMNGIADTCFMMIHGTKEAAALYLGVRADTNAASLAGSALENSIRGNFPGTEIRMLANGECADVLGKIRTDGGRRSRTVVSVAQVPSVRRNAAHETYAVSEQGMEHFIDAMRGREYTAMIMADCVRNDEIAAMRTNLENIWSDLNALKTVTMQFGANESTSHSRTLTDSIMTSLTDSIAQGYAYTTASNSGTSSGNSPSIHTQYSTFGLGYGTQTSQFSGSSSSASTSNTNSRSNTSGSSKATALTSADTQGTSRSLTITRTNKTVEQLLAKIEVRLERLKEGEAFGLWNCAAYFASADPDTALIAANCYKATVCGEKSGNEPSYVNCWNDTSNSDTPIILESLSAARSPLFRISKKNGWTSVAGTYISGSELPVLMGFPNRSTAGLTVINMAPFGREVHRVDRSVSEPGKRIAIGRVRHMGVEENNTVELCLEHLNRHLLIAGTTGVGKTTLSVSLLRKLDQEKIPFMVIEPAKGEYADLLGGIKDLQVFTDSPLKQRMLHINPFIFNYKKISVLSHIDRLIDVFSACWPLYAAQPALLRECIEEAYMQCGWDLSNSVFIGGEYPVFPDFRNLLDTVPEIMARSKFAGESKGTYEGALLTRIAMLTHGVYGQIFNSAGSLSDQALFTHPCVVDLSKLGSSEVISLITGVLMIRLREYRMSKGSACNQPLSHVLILEEAHNLLKKDNSRNDEGGESVSGKSVEMLSRMISEMRGYGQGFMILDQAVSELHPSAIRNTATKIIMRLPDTEDQKAAAAALSLNEAQTKELSRLPERVGLVYQTGWLEPVMTAIAEVPAFRVQKYDEITYAQLKAIRGRLVRILLKMYQRNIFSYDELEKAVSDDQTIYEGKKRDLMTMFYVYSKEYGHQPDLFSSLNVKNDFFLRVFTDLLSCGDFLKVHRLPVADVDARAPYEKDEIFIRQCRNWHKGALKQLENYASGLDQNEYSQLLKLLLGAKADGGSLRLIRQVYKALYAKSAKEV